MARISRAVLLALALLLAAAPTAGAGWRKIDLRVESAVFYGASCTKGLCVVVGMGADPPEGQGSAGLIAAARRPLAGAGAWKPSDWKVTLFNDRRGYVPNFRDVSCPSPRFCLAVANKGRIYTTRHPLHGASAWRPIAIPGLGSLRFASCVSRSLCVVLAYRGQLLVSAAPEGGAEAWRVTDVSGLAGASDPFATPSGLDCTSRSFCAAADNETLYVTTDPASEAWSVSKAFQPPGPNFSAFGCASSALCLGGGFGALLSTTSPSDPNGVWTETPLGEESLNAIDCPMPSFCAASLAPGEVHFSTSPATGPWVRSRRFLDRDASLRALSCEAPETCVAGGRNGLIVASY